MMPFLHCKQIETHEKELIKWKRRKENVFLVTEKFSVGHGRESSHEHMRGE